MSRPRRPYGGDLPGRLQATMIRVLAAELSDQGRLARGKRYWSDGAVVDIVVGHGAVTAEILGSRPDPYVVTLEAAADPSGRGAVPSKRELWIGCTCPDDSGTGAEACKHAVAALFTLADEVSIEPSLLERWRRGTRAARPPEPTRTTSSQLADVIELHPGRKPSPHPGRKPTAHPGRDPALDARRDQVALLLQPPTGAAAPRFPVPGELEHPPIRDRALSAVVEDALAHLTIPW